MGFWRNLFGPSQTEVWSELATSLGADFVKGGWFTRHRVTWPHDGTVIVLDTYSERSGENSTTYTRISAVLNSSPGFDVHVTKRNFLSGMGDMFGMQRIAIGNPEIDEKFVVKGQPEARVQEFLKSPEIAAQIAGQPKFNLKLHVAGGGIFGGAKYNQLLFIEAGIIKNVTRLQQMFALFALSLDRIQEMSVKEAAT